MDRRKLDARGCQKLSSEKRKGSDSLLRFGGIKKGKAFSAVVRMRLARQFTVVILAYGSVAWAELRLHWYMGDQRTPLAQFLHDSYFYRKTRGSSVDPIWEPLLDLVIPAVLLGLVAGGVFARHRAVQGFYLSRDGWNNSRRVVLCGLGCLALSIVALTPFYAQSFTQGEQSWWLPMGPLKFIYMAAMICPICYAFFTAGVQFGMSGEQKNQWRSRFSRRR